MNIQLKASLEKALDEWIYENLENDIWINGYWPKDGTELCVKAIENILDAFDAEKNFIDVELKGESNG
jgi:hypothetical protein